MWVKSGNTEPSIMGPVILVEAVVHGHWVTEVGECMVTHGRINCTSVSVSWS